MKIKDNCLFHMFQEILYIDLKLSEGVGPGIPNFKWYKLVVQMRKKTIGEHTFEQITLSSLITNLPTFEIILRPC